MYRLLTLFLLGILLLGLPFLTGCSTAQEELELAEEKLDEALNMGAESIAEERYASAQDKFVRAMEEMRNGNEAEARSLAKESRLDAIDAINKVQRYQKEIEKSNDALER